MAKNIELRRVPSLLERKPEGLDQLFHVEQSGGAKRLVADLLEDFPPIRRGRLVRVKTPTGVITGNWTGYYGTQDKHFHSVGYPLRDSWTHGLLRKGDEVLDPVPSYAEWTAAQDGGMLVSAVLLPTSQKKLLSIVRPVHPTVYAHHVTMAYKPDAGQLDYYQKLRGQRATVIVTGEAADDKGQAVSVLFQSQNKHPHITISVAMGVSPAYSNELLANTPVKGLTPFYLDAVITIEPTD